MKKTNNTPGKRNSLKSITADINFAAMQKTYGLKSAQQIQMRIIFNLLLAIIEVEYGKTPSNLQISNGYKKQWQVCEKNWDVTAKSDAQPLRRRG
jgi:hypothetical protein